MNEIFNRMKVIFAVMVVMGLWSTTSFAQAPGSCTGPDDAAFASLDGGCKDLATGKVWSQSMGYSSWGSWDYAKSYCLNLVEGGMSDWRLPTLNELLAVSNNGASSYLNAYGYTWKWSITTPKGTKNAYAVTWISEASPNGVASVSWPKGSGWDAICIRP